jgi:disulfide bond formation protein DsbB
MQHLDGGPSIFAPERLIAGCLLIAAAVIVAALGLELIGGYQPCELCLKERWAYYAAIPLGILAMGMMSAGRPASAAMLILVAGAGMIANAGLGLYHAGVEWHWWPGPSVCTGGQGHVTNAQDLLDRLQHESVVRCDQPALKLLGLSLAAWNVPIGVGLSIVALVAGIGLIGEARK